MDIFDSRYFAINKWMLRAVGLWPFERTHSKYSRRLLVAVAIIAMGLPHFAGMVVNRGKKRLLLEHMGTIMFIIAVTVKIVSSIVYEDKLRLLYQAIANNWTLIAQDPREVQILRGYSEMGRVITLGWIAYLACATTSFVALPLSPMVLDVLRPLNASRARMYILNGEFLVDGEANYGKIYVYNVLACSIVGCMFAVCDTMYAVCIEHCLGLFAIISDRLQRPVPRSCDGDAAYQQMLRVIRLHSQVLHFTVLLESTYKRPFFAIIAMNLIYSSLLCVMTLQQGDNVLNLARCVLLCAGASIHLFYISWPGQKLIDHSCDLHRQAYLNHWYESSNRAKVLLKFFMQRCSKPCLLTAGGLYTMNFDNFLTIMKKSVSFMAVFSSFR